MKYLRSRLLFTGHNSRHLPDLQVPAVTPLGYVRL